MEPLLHACLVSVFIILFGSVLQLYANNVYYTFEDRGCDDEETARIVDAVFVESQHEQFYLPNNRRCSVTFQTPSWAAHFLVQLLLVDIRGARGFGCLDSLTVDQLYNMTSAPQSIVREFCGAGSLLSPRHFTTTAGHLLRFTWATGATGATGARQYRGFQIMVTAMSTDRGRCALPGHFWCDNSSCISSDLVCDGLAHCLHQADEHCGTRTIVRRDVLTSLPPPSGRPTSVVATSPALPVTTSVPVTNEVYLWLPLIVVVIFTGVMVTLIMIGRRTDEPPLTLTGSASDEQQRSLHLELNGNPGYEPSEGAPETPPPTYDVIARQTSYVSHISQTSDQISLPPGYDEALDFPNDSNGGSITRSRSRPTRSRSATRAAHRGSNAPNWARLFSRSVSATEPSANSAALDVTAAEMTSVFDDDRPAEGATEEAASTPGGDAADTSVSTRDASSTEHRVSFFL